MLDYNFFSSYLNAGRYSRNKILALALVLALFISITVGGYICMFMKTREIKEDINSMEVFLNSEDTLEKRRQVEQKREILEIVRKYNTILETVSGRIEKAGRIKSSLIEDINTTLPQGVFFKSVTYTPQQINIQGTAKNRIKIAELLHNMKSLGFFKSVHVSTIQSTSQELDSYTFTMNCTFKGVNEQ